MSIWAAVAGAAGNYLQQAEEMKAAEAEAERIRRKEEMAEKLKQETWAREDMKDQQAAERARDLEMRQSEIANRARMDMLEGRRADDVRADKQLGLQAAAQRATRDYRNDAQRAREEAKTEKETEKAQAAIDREVERVVADIRAMDSIEDEVKWNKIQEYRDEVREFNDPQVVRQIGARRINELFRPKEDQRDPTTEGIRPL